MVRVAVLLVLFLSGGASARMPEVARTISADPFAPLVTDSSADAPTHQQPRSLTLYKKIRIAAVEFRDTPAVETTKRLGHQIAEAGGEAFGVPLVLSRSGGELTDENRVTFRASDIRADEAVLIVADSLGWKVKWLESSVVIGEAPLTGPMETRCYSISSTGLDSVLDSAAERDDDGLKDFFGHFGVEWPEGSSVRCIRALNKLVIHNTKWAFEDLEQAMLYLRLTPPRIAIEALFFEMAESVLDAHVLNGTLDVSVVRESISAGEATLLACPRLVTSHAQQAEIKCVEEFIYPTEFGATMLREGADEADADTRIVQSGVTNRLGSSLVGAAISPKNFEVREVGAILDATPKLQQDSLSIEVHLRPHLTSRDPEWREYDARLHFADGKSQTVVCRQPTFYSYGTDTSVLLHHAVPMIIGVDKQPWREGKGLVLIVRATLLDSAGQPLRLPWDR